MGYIAPALGIGSTYNPEPYQNRSAWRPTSPRSQYRRKPESANWAAATAFETAWSQDPTAVPWFDVGPLPDSPPNYRQQGRYYGKGTSVLLAGANEQMDEGEGTGQQEPTDAERYAAAMRQIDDMRNVENQLRADLATA